MFRILLSNIIQSSSDAVNELNLNFFIVHGTQFLIGAAIVCIIIGIVKKLYKLVVATLIVIALLAVIYFCTDGNPAAILRMFGR